MSQERQYVKLSLKGFDNLSATRGLGHFLGQIGIWAPVIARNQKEKDYLVGMGLMLGLDVERHIHAGVVPKLTDPRKPTWLTFIGQIRSMINLQE